MLTKEKDETERPSLDGLRASRKVALRIVKHYASSLQFADVSLQVDREAVLDAIKKYSVTYKFEEGNFLADPHFVLEAVKSAAVLSGISSDYRVITLPKKEDFIEEILNDFSDQTNVDLLKIIGIDEDFLDQFNFLSSDDKMQARLPFFMRLE